VKIGLVVLAENRLIDGNALWFGDFVKSLDILDRFSQSFHYMKALNVRQMGARLLLLEGDTAAPSGLLSRLCHAFLVLTI